MKIFASLLVYFLLVCFGCDNPREQVVKFKYYQPVEVTVENGFLHIYSPDYKEVMLPIREIAGIWAGRNETGESVTRIYMGEYSSSTKFSEWPGNIIDKLKEVLK